MWSLGWQETMVIFLLALVVFGPKKLPELGKNLAKGLAEFRRASSELKSTFDREMAGIERETGELKEVTQQFQNDVTNYDSYYENSYYDSGNDGSQSTSQETSTISASATQGADSQPVSGETATATADAVVTAESGNSQETVVAETASSGQVPAEKPVAHA